MRKFKLTIEYDGAGFCGWQTQAPNFRTAQSHLEDQLKKIFKRKLHCHASGRTDSGVHALGQVAHVKVDTPLTPVIIQKALNAFLDKDMRIINLEEVPYHFDAQADVLTKTYRYIILNREQPSALWRERAWHCPQSLNLVAMRKAAQYLKGKHDFTAFQSAGSTANLTNAIRTIKKLSIIRRGEFIHIDISADGFLYKMVRNIVSVLTAVGEGQVRPSQILQFLKMKVRKNMPASAPAWGLYLLSVQY